MKAPKRSTVASIRAAAVGLAVVLTIAGCTARTADTAETGDDAPITIGASWPQSGPLGAVAPGLHGLQAYIQKVNDDGGVNGHQINLVTADDAYDPARLADNQRKFVEQDKAVVVLNFGGISIPGRDYLNGKGVAGISLAGNSALSDVETYPLQRAFWPDVSWEGQAQAAWLKANKPDAVIGYVGFNNDLTDSQIEGLSAGGIQIAQKATVAPGTADLSAQVSQFQAAGVDTVIINIGAPTVGALVGYMHQIGYTPTVFLSSTTSDYATAVNQATPEAVTGAYSFEFFKDPADPQWADDEGVTSFISDMEAAGFGDETGNALAINGYGLGAALVEALKNTDDYTSEGIIKAYDSLDGFEDPMLRPGITFTGGPDGRIMFQYTLAKFDGESWKAEGDVVNALDEGWVK